MLCISPPKTTFNLLIWVNISPLIRVNGSICKYHQTTSLLTTVRAAPSFPKPCFYRQCWTLDLIFLFFLISGHIWQSSGHRHHFPPVSHSFYFQLWKLKVKAEWLILCSTVSEYCLTLTSSLWVWVLSGPYSALCKSLASPLVSLYFTMKNGKQVQEFVEMWNIHENYSI